MACHETADNVRLSEPMRFATFRCCERWNLAILFL
jgi:hypothetical protein